MRYARARRPARALLTLAVALAIAGCGKSGAPSAGEGPAHKLAPVLAPGAVSVATRNTTRLGGATVAADAAAVARTVYPGLTSQSRPLAVVLVDQRNWPAALAASSLASAPLGAPLLYANGPSLPQVTVESLAALHPAGAEALGGAQAIELGTNAALAGLRTRSVPVGGGPAVTAAAIESLLASASGGGAPHQAIVVAADAPRSLQMPAAGLAAESGAPILFVAGDRVPAVTAATLRSLGRPSIYLVDAAQVGSRARRELHRFGPVIVVSSGEGEESTPAANAIAVARFTDGSFGWGVKEPGHGLVFANLSRPLDGPAAAPLSASGDYGPLLLLEAAGQLPSPLSTYLTDIQPAYTSAPQFRPVRGVYNHGWLIGGEAAIATVTQAEIDDLLEISPRHQSAEEASVTQAE
jgi:hypothetical protein